MAFRQCVRALPVALALAAWPLGAQADARASAVCTVPQRTAQPGTASAQYGLTQSCSDSLRAALVDEQFDKALRILFGQTYNPKMANWVVFVDRAGVVRQAVMQDGRRQPLLRAQKYVYATVFLDDPPTRQPTSMEWPTLELSRRSMDYAKESFTTFLITSFGAGRVQGGGEPVRTVMDIDRSVKLRRMTTDTTRSMWFGSARLEIGENTDVQFALNAVGAETLPGGLTRITTTVNNAKSGRMEFGLTIGSSFGPGLKSEEGSGVTVSYGAQSNVFVTSYVNLIRSHLPRVHRSLGFVFGTNIARGNILDEVLAGIGLGRVLGDGGVVVGVVYRQVHTTYTDSVLQRPVTETKRVPRFFLGFDVRM